MTLPSFWSAFAGRELDCTPLPGRAAPARVVACLNVWNDAPALDYSLPTWAKFVDHVIAVDGSYDTIGAEISSDRTRGRLEEAFGPTRLTWIEMPGRSQCDKRTAYLQAAGSGDMLFVIDADEHVLNGEALRDLPCLDVGWVRIRSPLYAREYGQPRLFRWRPNLHYAGRHHWMYEGDRLFCTHQYGGPGFAHRPVNLTLSNERKLARSAGRSQVKATNLAAQMRVEAPLSATPRTAMSDSKLGARESLQILNYAYRDDGLAPSRLHTAINRTTPHSSIFFKSRPGPFGVPTQYDVRHDGAKIQRALTTCDVMHVHSVITGAWHPNPRPVPHVFHHHGSMLRANSDRYMNEARKKQALVVVANLELLSWTEDYPAFFLPNTMPVARYQELARANHVPEHQFRICHSPTHQHRKGTKEFLAAIKSLQGKGYPVWPVMIENTSHAETLAVKATCHAAFDSFWLGMQCSGLEAASMGMPVIAGDETVRDRYLQQFGQVPYTFANDQEQLEDAIRRLMDDPEFRSDEAGRVFEYVATNHDESAVALTYLDYLDLAFDWRNRKKRNGDLVSQSLLRRELAPT